MKIGKSYFAILAATLALNACSDYDNGFDAKSIQYEENFANLFGKVDPNQDWTMAKQITVNVSGVENGTLEIFDKDPLGSDALIFTKKQITDGQATVKFDVIKGLDKLYVRINKGNGYYPLKGYYNIENGQINIGSLATRAYDGPETPTGTSRVTRGNAITYETSMIDWTKSDNFHWTACTTSPYYIDGYYVDNTNNQNIYGKSEYYSTQEMENLIPLYNVLNAEDDRPYWYVKDIAHFFTTVDYDEPIFGESQNHLKYMLEGSTPHFKKDLVYTMANDGPVTFDYFAKGTQFDNQFGYFYYTGETPTVEEFKAMPKFILCDNMSTNSGQVTTSAAGTQINWDLISPINIDYTVETNWDTMVKGTRLQLTYFGADGKDATGSYTFPKGTKIGLFIWGKGSSRDNVITSISSLNLKMYDEVPHAASFKYNDQIVFAMEDQANGGDCDINDCMFIANGDFENDIPTVNPTESNETPTWIVCCEDLGGSYDYDFNDVVFGLRMTPITGTENSKLDLVPLAAGGTLPANIEFKEDGSDVYTDIGEIHNLITSGAETNAPLNAAAGSAPSISSIVNLEPEIPSSTSINTIVQNLRLRVDQEDGEQTVCSFIGSNKKDAEYADDNAKKAPQMMLLPPGWDWPSEGTSISTIYDKFANWVSDADVTTWCCAKKDGATNYVTNPLQASTVISNGDGTIQTSTKEKYKITLLATDTPNDPNTILIGSSNVYTIKVEGVSDLSDLTVGVIQVGVYNNVLTAEKDATDNSKITVTAPSTAAAGSLYHFYVKLPEDDTHLATRLEYTLTVVKNTPDFAVSVSNVGLEVGETAQFTMSVSAGDVNASGWTCVSSDNNVAEVSGFNKTYGATTIKAIGKGTATITITHPSTANYESKSVTINVTVGEAVYSDPIDITNCCGSEYKTQVQYGNTLSVIPVDLSSLDIGSATGAQIIITGSGENNQISILDKDLNYINGLSYQSITGTATLDIPGSILSSKKFFIASTTYNSGKVEVSKLELKYKTISTSAKRRTASKASVRKR